MPVMPSIDAAPAGRRANVFPAPPSPPSSVSFHSAATSSSSLLYPPPHIPSIKVDNGSNSPNSPTPASSDPQPPPLNPQTSFSTIFGPSFSRTNSQTSGPSSSQPGHPLVRQLTTSRPPPLVPSQTLPASFDWRSNVTIEERLAQRHKIQDAYARHCPSYQQLLDTVVAVEEELIFAAAVGRLEYFKSGIDWESRLRLKKGQLGLIGAEDAKQPEEQQADEDTTPKRSRPDGEEGKDAEEAVEGSEGKVNDDEGEPSAKKHKR